MDEKSGEDNDNFDYLSYLKNGFETNVNKDNNKDDSDIEIISNNSDSNTSDSNECLIIGLIHNSSDENRLQSSQAKTIGVKKELFKEENTVGSDVKSECVIKEVKVFHIKNEIKSELKPNMFDSRHLKPFDSKPSIGKQSVHFDSNNCKPFGVKKEKNKDKKDISCQDIKCNEIAIQTEDNDYEMVEQNDDPKVRFSSPQNCNESHKHIMRTTLENSRSDRLKSLEDLGNLDDCHNIEDIDISSSKIFADIEVNAKQLLGLTAFSYDSRDQSISQSFKSLPNASVNHTKNREVVRKRTTLFNKTEEQTEYQLSRVDYENWLSETIPRYSPFIAQKGDRVVYLRDAHEIYVNNEVQPLLNSYRHFYCTFDRINDAIKTDDYIIYAIVSDVKFYEIMEYKFSVITLKSDSNGRQFEFNVLYRPNRGICEFLVLDQFYKNSQKTCWRVNSEFRSLWKKSWWIGFIERITVFNDKYPKSLFKCFEIKWNTGETGRLSPWDLFVVDPNRLPKNRSNGILTTREDLLEINYKPSYIEWPFVNGIDVQLLRCHECKRIYRAIKAIQKHISKEIISDFKTVYHKSVAYPVSLQLIKQRLKNMFYRRLDSIKTDVNYLKINCKLYLKKSQFKRSDDFVELILCIVNDSKCSNEEQYLNHIKDFMHLIEPNVDNCHNSDHFNDVLIKEHSYSRNVINTNSKRSLPSNSSPKKIAKSSVSAQKQKIANKKKKIDFRNHSSLDKSVNIEQTSDNKWKTDSQKFIDELYKKEESVPFREPVDANIFPTYYTVIKNPMDLSAIRDNLANNIYLNPKQMRQDLRLMFANAKLFTKDAKAPVRIYAKTLSNLCETQLRTIIVDWERVRAFEENVRKGKTGRKPISRDQLWGYGSEQYY